MNNLWAFLLGIKTSPNMNVGKFMSVHLVDGQQKSHPALLS
jgi:hypothetical protein